MSEADDYSLLADILLDLEAELRSLDLWQHEEPAPEALASEQPFCVDTLAFHEWLQFILIERMKVLIELGAPLPQASGILAMAEESYRDDQARMRELFSILERFDNVISSD